jgi:hypothetical protein
LATRPAEERRFLGAVPAVESQLSTRLKLGY